jgi:hypothetical protein
MANDPKKRSDESEETRRPVGDDISNAGDEEFDEDDDLDADEEDDDSAEETA